MRKLTATEVVNEYGSLIRQWRKEAGGKLGRIHLGRKLRDELSVDISDHNCRHVLDKLLEQELDELREARVTFEQKGDDAILEVKDSRSIRTLDDLLEATEVDLDEWQVEKHLVNKWDAFSNEHGTVELFQVKAWLARRRELISWNEMRESLFKSLSRVAKPLPVKHQGGEHLVELDMSDFHIDKRPFTGERSLDEVYAETMELMADLMAQIRHYDIAQFNMIVGNDLFTAEGNGKTSNKQVPQDIFVSHHDAFNFTAAMKREIIEHLRQIAPVNVIVVGGNHDYQSTFHLGTLLFHVFRDDELVTVDYQPVERKYEVWGNNSFCYLHQPGAGGLKNMPATIGAETDGDWYSVPFRFIKLGHQHRKQEGIIQTYEEDQGIQYHWLRALSVVDQWHHQKGYQSLRGMEAYVYHRHKGPRGNFEAFLEE